MRCVVTALAALTVLTLLSRELLSWRSEHVTIPLHFGLFLTLLPPPVAMSLTVQTRDTLDDMAPSEFPLASRRPTGHFVYIHPDRAALLEASFVSRTARNATQPEPAPATTATAESVFIHPHCAVLLEDPSASTTTGTQLQSTSATPVIRDAIFIHPDRAALLNASLLPLPLEPNLSPHALLLPSFYQTPRKRRRKTRREMKGAGGAPTTTPRPAKQNCVNVLGVAGFIMRSGSSVQVLKPDSSRSASSPQLRRRPVLDLHFQARRWKAHLGESGIKPGL